MNILLTSAGRRTYLVKYFKKSLSGIGKVHVSNSTSDCPAFKYADEKVVSPLIYSDSYIHFLKNYCIKNDISLIIPLFDIDVLKLSEYKNDFASLGINVLVGDKSQIEICNDKYLTYKILSEKGLNLPSSYLYLEEVKENLKSRQINFPLIVKPRWGMGSIGVYEANNINELDVFYEKVAFDINNSYLKYESSLDKERSVLIQEKVEGTEYGLDVINDLNGVYQTTIVKEKLEMRAGETDAAIIRDSSDLKDIGKIISDVISHPANLDADVIFDGNRYFVLELNARFGGGFPFSYMAGVDLPSAIVNWILNKPLSNELEETIGVKGYKDITINMY
ncbi:ATP-grasp domain-containing protein [Enterococcus casseliflavus]|uniref:ATP-grasp domain-containing protein n=1 Tax=Enterococcus casseliflavus TaxID=37734 RepID=UPI003D12E7A5